jgi:uncharacterized membrane protein
VRRALVIACRLVLAGVFLAAAVPKILSPHDFALAVFRYQMLPDSLINLMGIYLPWIELAAALALLVPQWSDGAAAILFGLLAVFAVAIAINLVRGVDMACGCFSTDPDAERMTWLNVVRNLILMALTVVAAGPRKKA